MSDLYWDPFTPELRDDPYPLWKRMRDEAPVWHNDQYDFWVLTRFHDIEHAHKDYETFVSNHGTTVETMTEAPVDTGMIIWTDPPRHTMLRKLVSRAFTSRRVSALEDRVREVCAELLDPHVGESEFDYVQDFSAILPPTMISMLLGVPEQDRDYLRGVVDDIFHIEEGAVGMVNDVATKALVDMNRYLADQFEDRKQHPRDDMFTDLLNAEIVDDDGEPRRLTDSELTEFVTVLFAAGTETVARHLGWAVDLLDQHPDQRAELAADLTLVPNAIEEILRFEPPSPVNARFVTRDVDLPRRDDPRRVAGRPADGLGRSRRARVSRPGRVRRPSHLRPAPHPRLRDPLLSRCRARPHGGPHRGGGDAQALAGVDGRSRPGRAALHEHRARIPEPPVRRLRMESVARFDNRITRLLGVDVPIANSPMGFVAKPDLVAAVVLAGGIGLVPGSMGIDISREDIKRVRDMTDRPFGVNLPIAYVQDPAIADMLVEEGIPYVTTSAGSPMAYTPILKAAGIKVLHVVTSLDTAKEAVDAGVDGLVVEGIEGAGLKGQYTQGIVENSLPSIGQVAGRIDSLLPVADIMRKTVEEFGETIQRLAERYLSESSR